MSTEKTPTNRAVKSADVKTRKEPTPQPKPKAKAAEVECTVAGPGPMMTDNHGVKVPGDKFTCSLKRARSYGSLVTFEDPDKKSEI